ncbi:MAG: trypsin-like peptidase domain-containing protein [Deltaproteobacteria bacterium]|nr:trypsin-like peptidase domain-containing protein [Deltaproteobacteria bacterium]
MFVRKSVFVSLAVAVLFGAAAASAQGKPPSSARRTPIVLAVERTKSAVVNISAQEIVRAQQARGPLDLFFGGYRAPRNEVRTSLGSGFVFDAAGYVLTNYHVVANGTRIQVSFDDGSDFVAKVVGTDPGGDLAVLKIEARRTFPAAPLGSTQDLMLGEPAVAIGNPLGLNHSVTVGAISALHRTVRAEGRSYYDFIQTDASINPGNSGGPLLNADGDVIGINSAVFAGAQGIGFAIPIDRALRVARELVRSGEIADGYWGFDAESLGLDPAEAAQLPPERQPKVREGFPKVGARVVLVEGDSPANASGLRIDDAIVRVDSSPVRDADELRFLLHDVPPGTAIKLGVVRSGSETELTVTSRKLTPEQAQIKFETKVGLALVELSPKEARELGYDTPHPVIGVKFVQKNTPAAQAGLRRGDLVRSVNSAEVESLADLRTAVAQARRSGKAVVLMQRGSQLVEFTFDAG